MRWFWRRAATPPPAAPEPAAGLVSDVGCHRELNEDSAQVVRAGRGPRGDRGLLLVVADGMGGHEAGEVASRTAVETIATEYPTGKGSPGDALADAFQKAHRRIRQLAAANPSMQGMGTTCTALAIVGRRAWAVHVGDSRLYLVRAREIYQLSEDHTQCMDMVRKGALTLDEARRHEDRNVLVRAMGSRRELEPMTWPESMEVRPGDWFVLCSDGLHDLVSDTEIRDVVGGAAPEQACRKLVQMARDRGGYDNITVAAATVPSGAAEPQEEMQTTRQIEVPE